jgi:tRNA nucleotidyltransferase (CCA-adding enzyme)
MQSNDIDIALTDIMGEDFAHHFVAFANSKGLKTGEPTIINPNPEQSKHLQTARINNVYGLELDLVNLRSEEYADNSRIPTSVVRSLVQPLLQSSTSVSRPLARPCKTPFEGTLLLMPYFTTFTPVPSKTGQKR